MPLFAIAPLVENVFSALAGASIQTKVPVHVPPQGLGTAHLDRGLHPLLPNEPKAMSPSLAPGKALLQQMGGSELQNVLKDLVASEPKTRIGRLLQLMPSTLAPVPIDRVLNHWKKGNDFASNNKWAITPSRTDLGGYLGEPQAPPFLPGSSDVPRPERKEEYLADPKAMQPAVTGRPGQRWVQPQQGFAPIGMKPSDFVHQSAEDDFWKSIEALYKEAKNTKKILHTVIDPRVLDWEVAREWNKFLSNPNPPGPDQISGSVERLYSSSNDEKVYLYRPSAEIMGEASTVVHPDVPGHNSYGVLATYLPRMSGLKVEINSNIPNFKDLQNHWGSGDAMMKALLQTLEEDGIQPKHILVRPSELWEHREWAQGINENLIKLRDRVEGSARVGLDKEINRLLRDVGGIGTLLDQGYRVVNIKPSIERGAPLGIHLERQPPSGL